MGPADVAVAVNEEQAARQDSRSSAASATATMIAASEAEQSSSSLRYAVQAPVPAWQAEYESDTMENIVESALEEEPFDLDGALGALGPEPPTPPEEPEPKPVSNELKRFIGTLTRMILGDQQERENSKTLLPGLPGAKDIVLNIQNAAEKGFAGTQESWKLVEHIRGIANAAYARTEWWRKRCETLERALETRYKDPDAAKKHRDTMEKNLDRARRVVSHMRVMMAKMLTDGIPRTREQLDDLVRECQLSQAKEFRAWLIRFGQQSRPIGQTTCRN